MTRLPPSASIAEPLEGAKLHAPSAARNAAAIVDLLRGIAPATGRALEIASGTGQHVLALATALPHLDWHPSEIEPARLASIDAHAADARLPNLRRAQRLDATQEGWARDHAPYDLIHLGNLLHLISDRAAHALLAEAPNALGPAGVFTVYGPFLRAGVLTSEGDARFDAELRAADPAIGYKDDLWITEMLTSAGLLVTQREMPANNLVFIARKVLR